MPWDLALDGESGDFLFGASRDLLGVMDAPLVNQRILIRCKIPRGTFIGDEEHALGSDIPLMDSLQHADDRELISAVQSALSPMVDIQVVDITVEKIDVDGNVIPDTVTTGDLKTRRLIHVKWSPVSAIDEPPDELDTPMPTYDASVTVTY